MNGTARPLVLGSNGLPAPTPWLALAQALCKDV